AEYALKQHGPIACRAGDDADDERPARSNEAAGRGDGDEPGDDARGESERRRLALEAPFGEEPGEARGRGRDLRDGERRDRLAVREQSRAAVEAEPAEPEHARPEEREHHAVRVKRV